MTPEAIQARLKIIEQHANDPEAAHGFEDDLYIDVLRAIATGKCKDPQACAKEALKAIDIDFTRWYA